MPDHLEWGVGDCPDCNCGMLASLTTSKFTSGNYVTITVNTAIMTATESHKLLLQKALSSHSCSSLHQHQKFSLQPWSANDLGWSCSRRSCPVAALDLVVAVLKECRGWKRAPLLVTQQKDCDSQKGGKACDWSLFEACGWWNWKPCICKAVVDGITKWA
jgi:hypothetical protein